MENNDEKVVVEGIVLQPTTNEELSNGRGDDEE